MRFLINGEMQESRAKTLAGLLAELDYVDARIATAVNGAFVPAGERSDRHLVEGDTIEILAPMQGG